MPASDIIIIYSGRIVLIPIYANKYGVLSFLKFCYCLTEIPHSYLKRIGKTFSFNPWENVWPFENKDNPRGDLDGFRKCLT